MIGILFSCLLRNNTLQGIGQTNDLQLIIYPKYCDDIHDQLVEISLQLGNIKLAPNFTTFNRSRLVFTKRISPELFLKATEQHIGSFIIELITGEIIQQSFTKLQFTNQNLTNCWEKLALAYSSDKNQLGFLIEAVPAQCQFAQVVNAKLIYQTDSEWHEVVIKSGGSYNSQDYKHMKTTGFQRTCIGVFTDEEIQDCFTFLAVFQNTRNMHMKLVIEYLVGEIEVSVQEDLLQYYTPIYKNCMENLGMSIFITQQSASVSFSADEFLLCGFKLENVIFTMEIQLDSGKFSYNQKKNISISETLYFPQISFFFEEHVKPFIFSAKEPFIAHYFLSVFDLSGTLLQQASHAVKPLITCYNYMNFTVAKNKICANLKFNHLQSCDLTVSIPVRFKGLWVLEDVPPLTGELLPVFEISKVLTINFSKVEQKVCMGCQDEFVGGDCQGILTKFSEFHVKNPMYILIGIESLQKKSTDYKNYQVRFATDIYRDYIITGQLVVAVVFLLGFGSFLYCSNRKQSKDYIQ